MNMHVDIDASDWSKANHHHNVAASDRLLSLLMWRHPEQMRYNPRLLPAPCIGVSPVTEGFIAAKKRAEHSKIESAQCSPEYKKLWFDIESERPIVMPTIGRIQREVAKHYGVTRIDLISERRTAKVTWPRQVAIYLCRTLTTNSYPQIGRQFGGRDHTTCIHAWRKVEERMTADKTTANEVAFLTEILVPAMEAAE